MRPPAQRNKSCSRGRLRPDGNVERNDFRDRAGELIEVEGFGERTPHAELLGHR